jgi:iron complex transport system substrate-binding protein
MKKSRFLPLLLILAILCSFCACKTEASAAENPALQKPTTDLAGNPISLPENVDKVMTLAPSLTQIVQSMGYSDKIVGIDDYSEGYLLQPLKDVAVFNMQVPDNEVIIALDPDIIFVTGLSLVEGVNPLLPVINAGVSIVVIPSSNSLDGIKNDIRFIAECMGEPEKADPIVEKMDADIEIIKKIGSKITNKKRVHFEIAAAPYIYSFGSGTFLDEMINIIGAENVYAAEDSWIPVSEEAAIAANPDVILTSVNYIPDPVGEIISRPGWGAVNAVKNAEVFKFESTQTDIPNQFITEPLYEMAKFVYPDEYADVVYKK